jgi:magnesium transporter
MAITVHVVDERGYRTADLAAVGELLERPRTHLWITADEASPALEAALCGVLKLHPLTLADVFEDQPSPKLEEFDDQLYLVVHGVVGAGTGVAAATVEVDVVIGRDWVFTHHAGALPLLDELSSDVANNGRLLARGPAFVAHAVIERLTSGCTPLLESVEDEIDALERNAVRGVSTAPIERAFALKEVLLRVRRTAAYQREVLARIARGEFDLIPPAALPFFRDAHDRFVRVVDSAEGSRDLLSAAVDVSLSAMANRANAIMRVLGAVSAVLLPLAFIAGVYGMNFTHMPETKWRVGYPAALALMVVVAIVLVRWFRRRRWL